MSKQYNNNDSTNTWKESASSSAQESSQSPYLRLQSQTGGGNSAAQERLRQNMSGEPLIDASTQFRALADEDTDGFSKIPENMPDSEWIEMMFVGIIHDKERPLIEDSTPELSELYTEIETESDTCPSNGDVVEMIMGNEADPILSNGLVDEPLYIGGAPRPEDIAQGGMGDCYFLAPLHQIVSQDPSAITDNLSVSGNSVSFTFQVVDSPEGDVYREEKVTTSADLLFAQDSNGKDDLVGAEVFADPEISESAWWVAYDQSLRSLDIHREDRHEAAAWVAYLEKLYALFAQKHGKYGDLAAPESDLQSLMNDDGTAKNMTEMIDGGFENRVYQMFYGADVTRKGEELFAGRQNQGSIVESNKKTITHLLLLSKGEKSKEKLMLTVWASIEDHIQKFDVQVKQCVQSPEIPSDSPVLLLLFDVLTDISLWKMETDEGKKEQLVEQIAKLAESLIDSEVWMILDESADKSQWQILLELAGNVQYAGTDTSDDERNVYSGHAYSVMGAVFRDVSGVEIQPDVKNLDTDLHKISLLDSRVQIRNPHRTNEPDLEANGPSDGVDDGVFEFSLDQFFRNFTATDFAKIE